MDSRGVLALSKLRQSPAASACSCSTAEDDVQYRAMSSKMTRLYRDRHECLCISRCISQSASSPHREKSSSEVHSLDALGIAEQLICHVTHGLRTVPEHVRFARSLLLSAPATGSSDARPASPRGLLHTALAAQCMLTEIRTTVSWGR